jgi:hypothetical protein
LEAQWSQANAQDEAWVSDELAWLSESDAWFAGSLTGFGARE